MRVANYIKPVDKEEKRNARKADLENIVGYQMRIFQKRMKKHFDEEKFMPFIELGEYTKTTRQTLSKWSKGISSSDDIADLCTIANILDCEVGYLVGEFDCRKREVADIQEEIGLSECAIHKLRNYQKIDNPLCTQYQRFYSEFICNLGISGALVSIIPKYFKIKKEGINSDSYFTNKEEALSCYEFLIVKAIMSFLTNFFENEEIEEIILDAK